MTNKFQLAITKFKKGFEPKIYENKKSYGQRLF